MATVTGLTAARMEAIEAASVVNGYIDGIGHLILVQFDTTEIDAGSVLVTVPDASDTVEGKVELATDAETITGTDATRAVTPAGLQAKVASATAKGIVELATDAEAITGTDTVRAVTPANLAAAVTTHVAAASATVAGKVELATDAEAITGTDTVRAVTPANLAAAVTTHVAAASTSAAGKVELATDAETQTGTDTTRAVTPASLKASVSYIGITGEVRMYAGIAAPTGWLFLDGSSQLRATYPDLFAVMCPTLGTMTVTIATPGVITFNSHGLVGGDKVFFTTTGALPTGLSANTVYYVLAASITSNTFRVSATDGGAAINTTGSQSGVHTLLRAPYGIADSTHFNLPDSRGRAPVGADTSQTEFNLGESGGEKTHTLTAAEVPALGISVRAGGTLGSNDASDLPARMFGGSVFSFATTNTGSGGSHNNLQPYFAVNFIIKT